MIKQVLSTEQMKHLQELGLGMSDESNIYYYPDFTYCRNRNCTRKEQCKRYLKRKTDGLVWILVRKGKSENCVDFIKKGE